MGKFEITRRRTGSDDKKTNTRGVLLRSRRKRPRSRTTDKRDELAPLHVCSQAQEMAS